MDTRNPGCEAHWDDNGHGERHLPVCMGGTATEGAFVTVVGCNNPEACTPLLNVMPGHMNYVAMDRGRVSGVYEVRRDTRPGITTAQETHPEAIVNETRAVRGGISVAGLGLKKFAMLPAEWIVPGLGL